MGTRSIVAIPTATSWKGRYVSLDGYPTGVGETVRILAQRDGIEATMKTLTLDSISWKYLDAEQSDELPENYHPERWSSVPGVGVTTPRSVEYSDLDEWIEPEDGTGMLVWGYVLRPEGVEVLRAEAGGFSTRGIVRYDDPDGMRRIQAADESYAEYCMAA